MSLPQPNIKLIIRSQKAMEKVQAELELRKRGGKRDKKPEIVSNLPDSLYDFVEMIRPTLTVDNEPFTWEGHEYLIEPYKAVRIDGTTSSEGLEMVLMCGAQVGKTIWGFLAIIFLALKFWGKYLGYFLPDQSMAQIFSDVRFKPMARSIPEIRPLWGEDPFAKDGDKRKTDQKRVRSIGPSQIFFSYMQGKTSTESIPMLGVVFDEVRRMMEGDIERAEERISHSPYPVNLKYSTAGYPDANIDKYFKRSNQNKFHSDCGCENGVVLADVFPECLEQKDDETFYVCPTCRTRIDNPRKGKWVAHNPESKVIGYHIPQILSCRQTAAKILDAFETAQDLQEFYNSKIGISYLAPESRIVSTEILQATVNNELQWMATGTNFAMGIDQMGGFNIVTLRYWGPQSENGISKSRLGHIEAIYSDDPWERCDELMKQYDVSVCVVDALPNINEARRFAQRHKGRVWLADYSYEAKGDGDICEWGDRPNESNSEQKSSKEIKNKFTVRISRFHGIEWNLMKYVHRMKEQPNERTLEAEVQDSLGRPKVMKLCEEMFWVHLQKIARRKVMVDEAQGKYKMIFENIGLDPHFLHADLYCELALSRVRPEGREAAFSNYADEQKKNQKNEHRWKQIGSGNVYQCENCKIAVRVPAGSTPEKTAASNGWEQCQQ